MFDENCFFSSGAPAARQSGTSANSPRWARGPRQRARAELTSPAPGGRGTPAARQSGARAPGTWLAGGLEQRARAARVPPDTFFESTYPEMQRKHIPRVNEYQS